MTDSQASTSPDGSRRQANEFPSPAGSSRPDQGSATKNLPVLLQEAEGNLEWKEGEFDKNAAGVASIAVAAIDGLNLLVKSGGKLNERDFNLIKELVDYIPQETIDSFFQELTGSVPPQSGGLLPVKQRTRPPPVQRLLSPNAPADNDGGVPVNALPDVSNKNTNASSQITSTSEFSASSENPPSQAHHESPDSF
ncbi:hypothetical protein N5P37_003262 [Trichoderma harzianum]|nr:hypothetical protein N5P37_003262 [Trichoderma harzianum]